MRSSVLVRAGAALGVFVALILVVGFYFSRPARVDVEHVVKADEIFANAARYDRDSSLILSPEQGMIVYGLRQGNHSQVATAAEITTPDSISVSSNRQYVLFHTNFVRPGTTLAGLLQQNGKSLGSDYWWLYNGQTKSYWSFPEGTLVAKFYKDSVVALIAGSRGENITTFTLTGESGNTTPVANVSDFYPAGDGYILQSTDNELLVTQGGVVSKKVADSTAIVGGTSTQLVITQKTGDRQAMAVVDLNSYDVSTFAEGVSGKQAWLGEGIILYGALKGSASELHTYNLATKKDVVWDVKQNGRKLSDLTPIILFSPTTALLQDNVGNYLLVSDSSISSSASRLFN